MKIIGILVIRDEADIIHESIPSFLEWLDYLFVYDTGSIDGSWEIVSDFAARDSRVIPVGSKNAVFTEAVRGYVFEHARGILQCGDWVARVDADEFYHMSPRKFIDDKVSKFESVVCMQYYNFSMTLGEAKKWLNGDVGLEERKVSIINRRRYYSVGEHMGEIRLFKYRKSMVWPSNAAMPRDLGIICQHKLPVRHYLYRDPVQIFHRQLLRKLMYQKRNFDIPHWDRNMVNCFLDENSQRCLYWGPEECMHLVERKNHLPKRNSFKHYMDLILHYSNLISVKDRIRHRESLFKKIPESLDIELSFIKNEINTKKWHENLIACFK